MPQRELTKVDLTEYLAEFLKEGQVPPADPGKRIIRWDKVQAGLGLRVTDKGNATFVVMRRVAGGKLVNHAIGQASFMDVEEAREEAREVLRTLRAGKTPREIEEEEKARRRAVAEEARRAEEERTKNAFSVVAEAFIAEHLPRLRHGRAGEAAVRNELIRAWSDRPAGAIDRSDVVKLIRDVLRRRGASAARKVFAQASRVFSWALGNDLGGIRYNPATGLKIGDIIGDIPERDRTLSDRELRIVWRAAGMMGYPFGTVYQLLILTGLRLNELAKARWDEIEDGLLTVPAERMKGHLVHVVPLCPMAFEYLDAVPRFTGPFIFTTTGGARPVSGFSKARARLGREIGDTVAPFVVHDFRRTVRSGLARIGIEEHVAERVLAHIEGGVKRTYNRYAYLDEKRDALMRWEARLREIRTDPASPRSAGRQTTEG
jgi:integrase